MSIGTLVLLRHGESEWNALNLFTGWVDVHLTDKGMAEGKRAGELLAEHNLLPDVLYTSLLRRAISTANLALDAADRHWIPVVRDWRLNERHYGALQGKNKAQTKEEYGNEQFMLWRRSYDTPPPAIEAGSEYSQDTDPRYANLDEVPLTECLLDVVKRLIPYWEDTISQELLAGRNVLVTAHGKLAACVGQAPRRHLGRGHRGPEHPDRNPAALRPRREPEAAQSRRHLPGSGGRSCRRRRGGESGRKVATR